MVNKVPSAAVFHMCGRNPNIRDQQFYLDRPYYKWKICINCPEDSQLTFGSAGFSQVLRADPVFTREQYLSHKES